jgi:hypothetical protein
MIGVSSWNAGVPASSDTYRWILLEFGFLGVFDFFHKISVAGALGIADTLISSSPYTLISGVWSFLEDPSSFTKSDIAKMFPIC